MISDQSQLSALRTAIDLAHGRVRLTPSQRELFEKHIEAIMDRIIAAQEKRRAKEANGK
ncbi:hypothetical protein LG047_12685 [Methylocystis sp. WRRC1]|uniref:hypothetical protein n=1 Tax=unclassified Methylocystis TaxID=2625913 RepID=UPI0001F86850|nr:MULTISPECIES: hypothetical protein [unclassified Methylocystis]MCC3246166.1 hypothetical protein [Methylocystis sp. WRRC1]